MCVFLSKRISLYQSNKYFIYFQLITICFSWNSAICSGPLGLSTGEIKDWQITASSVDEKRKEFCQASFVRLFPNHLDQAWCPRTSQSHQWIQVDFGTPTKVNWPDNFIEVFLSVWIFDVLASWFNDPRTNRF